MTNSIGFADLANYRSEAEACFDVVGRSLDQSFHKDLERTRAYFGMSSATVSFVGQVKAGKTALTNVVGGVPRLLPSDVNPWTSVVTSMHLNDPLERRGAQFTFMDLDDWESFRNGDGRMDQIARRAGLADEAERLKQQVDQIQARARARLGENFELLVGKRHHHDLVTTELISRYVCFDSAYEEDGAGRYADIVKAAAIFLNSPGHDLPLILQDTPGINDPFLIREQATLASLSGTDICVLTLSAAQALNMSDIGLIKIVLAREPDDVIIFVNRIDELENPNAQMSEIRTSIEGSLRHHGIETCPRILFGSAIWAEAALRGDFDDLLPGSLSALQRLAAEAGLPAEDAALSLSGVEQLRSEIASSLMSGLLHRVTKTAFDQCRATLARQRDVLQAALSPSVERVSRDDISTAFDDLERRYMLILERAIENHDAQYRRAFDEFLEDFVANQCDLLKNHIADHGSPDTWQADTVRWRRGLADHHKKQKGRLNADLSPMCEELVAKLRQTYIDITGWADAARVVPPDYRDRRALMATAATFAFDLPSTTWRKWLGLRQDPDAATSALRSLLHTEALDLYAQIERENILPHCNYLRSAFSGLIEEHREAALQLVDSLHGAQKKQDMKARLDDLAVTEQNLSSVVDLLEDHAMSFR